LFYYDLTKQRWVSRRKIIWWRR